jgi:hypothetical protein
MVVDLKSAAQGAICKTLIPSKATTSKESKFHFLQIYTNFL